jgi:FlaA1/EpsC-like NDP-sugar epimerase
VSARLSSPRDPDPARPSLATPARARERAATGTAAQAREGAASVQTPTIRRMRRRLRSAAVPFHRHTLPQLAVDGALVALAYWLSYQLRFDNGPRGVYARLLDRTWWWAVLLALVAFVLSGVPLRRWRYAGQRDLEAIVRACVAATALLVVAVVVLKPENKFHHGEVAVQLPTGVIVLFFLLTLLFVCGVRVLARSVHERRLFGLPAPSDARAVLIVGAGDGGRQVLREMMRNRELGLKPVGFIDDDPRKRALRVDGVRVRGNTSEDLPRILDEAEPDEVIIAIPSAPGSTRARVVRACRDRGIRVRTLPTVFELLQDGGGTVVRQVRDVRVEDILGREPVHMELDRVGAYLQGETVMVTGAGGSIGSELCRQIARVGPRRLILVDHAEDNLFRIERELEDERHVHPSVLAAVLADCKEEERMREVLTEHRPTVLFHAAAYKHVALMEANPVEAVRNNALATRVVAHVAGQLGVGRFVLVSTDKAVAPATVMGASKAIAEWSLEACSARFPATRYACVRFGNVLGSSGSVVPIFRRQIAAGGPITVTDARMRRYFMTIPEAVQLIIRSGSLVTDSRHAGAQVFVLDMGEPVLILELARAMIELSGLDPDRDIAIDFIGKRAGEKLDEELFNIYERPQPTPAEKILLAEREPLDPESVERVFSEISLLVLEGDAAGLAAKVTELSALRRAPAGLEASPASSAVSPPPATLHSSRG